MLKLFQYPAGYRYNSDSLLLFDFLSQDKIQGNVLDIGCGCGILGLLVKKYFENSKIYSIDIQEKNIHLAQKNADENNLEIKTICDDFLNFSSTMKFDFLISNPPFYKKDTKQSSNLHLSISRYQEFLPLEAMIKKINSIIKPNGSFFMCYDVSFLDEICLCLNKYKLKLHKIQFIHSNENKPARLVLIKAKKNSKNPCIILPPLFMYKGDKLNKKIEDIYTSVRTQSYDLP